MSRRSRERANCRPWEQEPDEDQIGDWSDGTGESCPNTGDMFEQEGADGTSETN